MSQFTEISILSGSMRLEIYIDSRQLALDLGIQLYETKTYNGAQALELLSKPEIKAYFTWSQLGMLGSMLTHAEDTARRASSIMYEEELQYRSCDTAQHSRPNSCTCYAEALNEHLTLYVKRM